MIMNSTKVAVVGSGISGAVCASILARNEVSVTLFESARGPGGRMSQRREVLEDGKELLFDHGAPYFNANNTEVSGLVCEWESKGLVACWKEKFGCFDRNSNKFVDLEQRHDHLRVKTCHFSKSKYQFHLGRRSINKRYVGIPGMNSICRALCHEPDINLVPELAIKLNDIPVRSCFALMIAFAQPLSAIPFKGFSIKNSEVLRWAHCDSSKPGRSTSSERWVLHSTMGYAQNIIAKTGFQKLSNAMLMNVAEEVFQELHSFGLDISEPVFKKAHRWGSAFPATSIAREEKCLWDRSKRLAICGDYYVSPNVEGAIVSGIAAASKLTEILSSL